METLGQIVRRDGIVLDTRANITPGARLTEDGRRIYRALAYDITELDRHGTTIAPNAFRAPALENLPLILWHDADNLPVGRVVEWTMTEQGPVAGFIFADTEAAREAELLVATGFLNGVSIGFIGWDYDTIDGVPTYLDVEVVELSLTPTPSSRGALVNLQRSIEAIQASAPAEEATVVVEETAVHCNCCSLRFKTGEPVEEVVEPAADETPAEAATVAIEGDRTIRLTSLINRLR
jgi:HK97 family phage prohead protease